MPGSSTAPWPIRRPASPLPPETPDPTLLPAGFVEALERAIAAVERYHAPQVRTGYRLEEEGVELEEKVTPLGRVGVYVPGGRASYPSTVVMTVVPARVAGVKEIAVATPPGSYQANAALRFTLARLGVTEVWGMGGAHAVAAFAYGTETVRRVDKIVGPGNAWVTAAKKLVVGDVAIDGIAGPSEVVIVADPGCRSGRPGGRSSGPGGARSPGRGGSDHHRLPARQAGRGRGRAPARGPLDRGDGPGVPQEFRRRLRGGRAGGGARPGREDRSRAPAARGARGRGAGPPRPRGRGDLPRRVDP